MATYAADEMNTPRERAEIFDSLSPNELPLVLHRLRCEYPGVFDQVVDGFACTAIYVIAKPKESTR